MTTETSQFPSIKTDISDFCQEFAQILTPFESALRAAREEIQGAADSDLLQRPLAGLSDAHHRLETLVSKVAEQQAYVIIFGPLKSGKSTLMNAISATYVSEVTSLPAYPCLVHVKHGETYQFVASRYNGDKLTYGDNQSLQRLIHESHTQLAAHLRAADENGEEFDPGVHYPEAIRRIDVEVPARNLKDSLTVLVDTPGLYSRMKFGYDLMTREFRNSAACAVFVVKTDTLFLEQVFEEFGDLLDLFSRIFLVVNIDTNKRDLEPDGSFKPSLESESPHEVIEAFESLVMSAPLRRAAEEGRLRIYPIDLLNSASASLIQAQAGSIKSVVASEATVEPAGEEDGETSPDESVSEGEDIEESEVSDELEGSTGSDSADVATGLPEPLIHPVASFAVFLNDLTDYLNSNDYLHEFMGDSLHLGKRLAGEVQAHCATESTGAFRERQAALRRELLEVGTRLGAVEKLEALDWSITFKRLRQENQQGAETFSAQVRREAEEEAGKRLDTWFESEASVVSLQNEWDGILDASRLRVEANCAERAAGLVSDAFGGIELNPEIRRAIEGLDQILEPAVEAARQELKATQPKIANCQIQIQSDDLPVKKGFVDWLLFRSLASVRRRLFGEMEAMESSVSAQVKQKRLGDEGRQALRKKVSERIAGLFPGEGVRVSEALLDKYIQTLGGEIKNRLASGKADYTRRRADLQSRLQDNARIQKSLDVLTTDAVQVVDALLNLRERYRATSSVSSSPEVEEESEAEVDLELVSHTEDKAEETVPANQPEQEDQVHQEVQDPEAPKS